MKRRNTEPEEEDPNLCLTAGDLQRAWLGTKKISFSPQLQTLDLGPAPAPGFLIYVLKALSIHPPPNLKTLVVSTFIAGGEEGMKVVVPLAAFLSSSHCKLTTLSAVGFLNDTMAHVLCKSIANNTTISLLDFQNNFITNGGAIQVLLKQNTTLKRLVLKSNNLSTFSKISSGIAASHSLTDLFLGSVELSEAGYRLLTRCLIKNKTLRYLNISHNPCSNAAQQVSEIFRQNNTLTKLDMLNCFLTSADQVMIISGLSENTALRSLDISGNSCIVDNFSDAFRRNTALTDICCSVDISRMCDALKENKGLTSMTLITTVNTDKKYAELCDCLRNSQIIQEIAILFHPEFAPTDFSSGPFYEAAAANNVLTFVGDRMFNLDKEGAESLAKFLTKSTSLTGLAIYDTIAPPFVPLICSGLSKCPKLKILQVDFHDPTGDLIPFFQYVRNSTILSNLSLRGVEFSQENLVKFHNALLENFSLTEKLTCVNVQSFMSLHVECNMSKLWISFTEFFFRLKNSLLFFPEIFKLGNWPESHYSLTPESQACVMELLCCCPDIPLEILQLILFTQLVFLEKTKVVTSRSPF
jgi:hypothetical protein